MEELMQKYRRIKSLASLGDVENAEKEVEALLKLYPTRKDETIINVAGIYIDTDIPDLVGRGAKKCERLLSSLKDNNLLGYCCFNLSNAYHHQIMESFFKNKTYFYTDKLIKKYIRRSKQAFNARPEAQIATNLGNFYDEIGRTLEAIKWYDKALKIDENFGMALGNKAIAIDGLARVSQGSLRYKIYAYSLLEKALSSASSVAAQNNSALEHFKSVKGSIYQEFCALGKEDLLRNGVDCSCPNNPTDHAEYAAFCLEHDLYANLHVFDYYCCGNIGDNISYSIVDDYTGERAKEMFLRIDDIRETFSTARYILWFSQNIKNIEAINKQTLFADNSDYVAHGINIGMLKTAYKTAYCCLDKISYALNYYLDLQIPRQKVNSKTIWLEDMEDTKNQFRSKLLKQHYSLYGIYATMEELKDRDSQKRNALEHRYYKLYSAPSNGQSVEDFFRETVDVLYTIKCLIVYLICFIENSELAKHTDRQSTALK